jgi:competence protein ComGF
MVLSKKYCNIKANSILESVIALTIISICLYFAIMIFAAVFTPRTSVKFYDTQNKVNELFFLAQLKNDSIASQNEDENLIVEEELINIGLKKITIQYKDSAQYQFDRNFYIQSDEK